MLNFTASNAFNISTCWYIVTGDTINISNTTVNCVNGTFAYSTMQLRNGTFNVTVYANSTHGSMNHTSMLFNVTDQTQPTFTSVSVINISTSDATITWATSENTTIKISYLADGDSTIHITSWSGYGLSGEMKLTSLGTDTTYYYNITANDTAGQMNLNGTNTFKTSKAGSSGGGNNGGGGGGGSSGGGAASASLSSIIITSFDWIFKGDTNVTINSANIAIEKLMLSTNANSSDVRFVIANFNESTVLNKYITAPVYQYIEINHTNLDASVLTKVKIRFKVAKSWLTAKSVLSTDIILVRYVKDWQQLATTMVSEDSTYIYYEAESPGLSWFAISVKKALVVLTPASNETKNVTSNTTVTGNVVKTPKLNMSVNGGEENTTTEPSSVRGWILSLVIVLLGVALGLFIYSRKRGIFVPETRIDFPGPDKMDTYKKELVSFNDYVPPTRRPHETPEVKASQKYYETVQKNVSPPPTAPTSAATPVTTPVQAKNPEYHRAPLDDVDAKPTAYLVKRRSR